MPIRFGEVSIPSSADALPPAYTAMHDVGRPILSSGFAALVFVEHLSFKSVAAIVAAEANQLRHG